MPQCWKCRTVGPSAELRRTPRGHVCKDQIGCKRRKGTVRPPKKGANDG